MITFVKFFGGNAMALKKDQIELYYNHKKYQHDDI